MLSLLSQHVRLKKELTVITVILTNRKNNTVSCLQYFFVSYFCLYIQNNTQSCEKVKAITLCA